ncbi:hypothetical protein BDZ94DRAFT_1371138, partial [Collybia nuda]
KGLHGKPVLETLFVELVNPAKTIQIPGLPKNVVPLVKGTKTITCIFPSDVKESLERQQVWVLPNFAMTDYAAQGKTRPKNVIHLHSCFSHMSYYTCLSRSASAAGTIIVQGFEPSVITRGCSGHLRQEFREHEILDDITRLRYEGLLPNSIEGHIRNSLIRQYQNWKGTEYVPDKVDNALKWSSNDPMHLLPIINDSPWQIVKQEKNKNKNTANTDFKFVPAVGTISVVKKRKLDWSDNNAPPRKKLAKFQSSQRQSPLGLIWDNHDYSCSYDSFFTILYNIWKDNPEKWTKNLQSIENTYLNLLVKGFQNMNGNQTFENVRNSVREKLHKNYPSIFPLGHTGTSVGQLAYYMLKPTDYNATSQAVCSKCNNEDMKVDEIHAYSVHTTSISTASSTQDWVDPFEYPIGQFCQECLSPMVKHIKYNHIPKTLVLEYPHTNIETSHQIKFVVNGKSTSLYLRGIIYHGDNHFTSRVISREGQIWYHDGMLTKETCIEDGTLQNMSNEELKECQDKDLVLAVYSQI